MRYHTFLLVLIFTFTAGAIQSLACSCLPPPTVLDEFSRSDIVITARFDGLEEATQHVVDGNVYRSYNARLFVEKVYKGGLSVGEVIKVRSGTGGDCTHYFQGEKIGQQFLVFTSDPRLSGNGKPPAGGNLVFSYSICSRSGRFEDKKHDLSYLDRRRELEGKTRLSGTVRASGQDLVSVENIKMAVVGPGIVRHLSTDRDGFFEIWDVLPGEYSIKYETPEGWKIGGYIVLPAKEVRYRVRKTPPQNTITVRIEPRKHTEANVYIEIGNSISGKVISPDGMPMKGVCVSAYWLTPTTSLFMIPDNCTNERGEFRIGELRPGNYRLEINSRGNITSENPFEKFYYPGVSKKENAEVIAIGAGTQVKDLLIKVTNTVRLITITGRVTLRDGTPVPDEEVIFEPDDDSAFGRVEVSTDKNGHFSFDIAEGAEGTVSAKANIYEMRFEDCPAIKELRKTRTGRASDAGIGIKIDGKSSRELLLRLPLPSCKNIS